MTVQVKIIKNRGSEIELVIEDRPLESYQVGTAIQDGRIIQTLSLVFDIGPANTLR